MIRPEAHRMPHLQTTTATGSMYRIVVIMLFAAAALLATINLPYAPRTWFDEGSHLHVPETLVRYGKYADISATPMAASSSATTVPRSASVRRLCCRLRRSIRRSASV